MISYAGVDLGYQTPELVSWVEAMMPPQELWLWSMRAFPGARLGSFPFRQPPPQPKIEIGTLFWPTSASRFARAHYLVDQTQLDAIRLVTYAGSSYQAAPLVLFDGVNTATTSLWMLPPRPLQALTDLPLYLLTLVDERFFWWFRGSNLSVTAGSTTWAQLFAQVATALDITLTVDPVAAAYLKPDVAFTLHDEALPLLLDAACYCVGQRLVRQLDGTCRTWTAVNSRDQTALQLAGTPVAGLVDFSAGGAFAVGTALPLADDVAVLPATVEVVFPVSVAGAPSGDISYGVTLASLLLPDFAGVTGFPGAKTFHCSATANGTGVPSNDAELLALAQQIATDFYRWQCGRLDLRIIGYPAYTLTGLDDHAEYQHDGDCGLRLVRGPWQDFLEELLHAGMWGSGGGSGGGGGTTVTGITVEETDGLPRYADVRDLWFLQSDGFVVTQEATNQAQVHMRAASISQVGIVNLVGQVMGKGDKFFAQGAIGVFDVSSRVLSGAIGIGVASSSQLALDTGGATTVCLDTRRAAFLGGQRNYFGVRVDSETFPINAGLNRPYFFGQTQLATGGLYCHIGMSVAVSLVGLQPIDGWRIDSDLGTFNITGTLPKYAVGGAVGGTATTGGLTFRGGLYLSGTATGGTAGGSGTLPTRVQGTATAAGTTQGTAAAFAFDSVYTSGASGTNGVILPDAPDGAIIDVWNASGLSALLVYPPVGETIGTLAPNAASTVSISAGKSYHKISATQWGAAVLGS